LKKNNLQRRGCVLITTISPLKIEEGGAEEVQMREEKRIMKDVRKKRC